MSQLIDIFLIIINVATIVLVIALFINVRKIRKSQKDKDKKHS